MQYSTEALTNDVLQCDDLEEFRENIVSCVKSQSELWKERILEIIHDRNYTANSFAKACGVSRPAVVKWCSGVLPRGREEFIRIGFAANYSYDEMNAFLTRYGKTSELYPKSLEDSACIFVLQSQTVSHTYEGYQTILQKMRDALNMSSSAEANEAMETEEALFLLLSLESEQELMRFVEENKQTFRTAYYRLYAYIEAFIRANCCDYSGGDNVSVYFLAEQQEWNASLRRCVSEIRQKKWFPLRRKIIALGLHLNMDYDQINEMLQLARMEPLCAKNPVECAIIYAIEDAKLNDMIFCDGSLELCAHVKNVLSDLDLPEAASIIDDLDKEV